MKKANIRGRGNKRNINSEWFTGKTWMRSISDIIESVGNDIYHVHFESGSRTKLHSHNGNQILIATAGCGSIVLYERLDENSSAKRSFAIKRVKSIQLSQGDVVHIPANSLHTHGSIDSTQRFSHIAINVIPKRNSEYKTIWYVSDLKTHVFDIIN